MPHTLLGFFFQKSISMIPEKTGELPIVTTVPIATPVNRIEVKNKHWNNAIVIAAKIVHFQDQDLNLIFRIRRAAINNTPPPIRDRVAATAIGDIPSSKNVCIVPVVPHKIAANKTNMYGKIFNHVPPNNC